MLCVTADRDSVCAGDDSEGHERSFVVPLNASVLEMIDLASQACPLASIRGGQATWILTVGGFEGPPLAVIAQQWRHPRLLVPETASLESIFAGYDLRLIFRYARQADPEAVYNAILTSSAFPSPGG